MLFLDTFKTLWLFVLFADITPYNAVSFQCLFRCTSVETFFAEPGFWLIAPTFTQQQLFVVARLITPVVSSVTPPPSLNGWTSEYFSEQQLISYWGKRPCGDTWKCLLQVYCVEPLSRRCICTKTPHVSTFPPGVFLHTYLWCDLQQHSYCTCGYHSRKLRTSSDRFFPSGWAFSCGVL